MPPLQARIRTVRCLIHSFSPSSPHKRGPMTTAAWNFRLPNNIARSRSMGPRLRGDDGRWTWRDWPSSYLQQLLGILIIHLVLLVRRQSYFVDQIDALLFQHKQRW